MTMPRAMSCVGHLLLAAKHEEMLVNIGNNIYN